MANSLGELFSKVHPGDVGIFGDPIEHTLSPLMQNAAFQHLRNAFKDKKEAVPVYHKFRIRPAEIHSAIELAKTYGLRGLNITLPHKEAASHLTEELDPLAKKMGAVNTLVFSNGHSKGFNTDSDGFRRSLLEDLKFDPKGKKVLVWGAGGTARVIIFVLQQMGAKDIFVWNRHPERLKVITQLSENFTGTLHPVAQFAELPVIMAGVELIVNATSLGLRDEDVLPVPHIKFQAHQSVFDVIYHRETKLLLEARKSGAKAIGGLGMLIYQGAKSFEIWTGQPAPLEVMRQAVLPFLKEV